MRTLRVIAVLAAAFLLGAVSTEGVVRLRSARAQAPAPGDGAVGDLVSFEVRSEDGSTLARSRLVSPGGKLASVTVRDPADPTAVRMVLRVTTTREASGSVCVNYAVQIPELSLTRSGRVWVKPGVESTLPIGHDLVAVFTALPVPSKAFDRYIESERAIRAPRAS
ncbi:MAG TPA: hypothetical protein VFM45_05040 [Anaeromyxobacteraceae bacterium]|nr:hypothetical protein [Anaeromyxobacteraceae bacterium]